jgi:hypothetical protein
MVLAQAQTTAFFQDAAQMGLPNRTVTQLATEGITDVTDLVDFKKEHLELVAKNLRAPPGRVPHPDAALAAAGPTIPTPPFVIGAISLMRLEAAADMIRYYETVGCALTPQNIWWEPTIKTFAEHWKALQDRKDGETLEVPRITRQLPVIQWTEVFADYCNQKIGARTIPLAYVIRTDVDVPAAAPPLAPAPGHGNQVMPYSVEHGSVERELVARASHQHTTYATDNADVYYVLMAATTGTEYYASVEPFNQRKDGRGAWISLRRQYAGEDKFIAEIKRQEDIIHTHEWKGQSNFTLEKFIGQHHHAYVTLQECANHVQHQLLTEFTWVQHLLQAIQCADPGLQAAMALVKADKDGLMNDFEAAASYLLPYNPVAKKRKTQQGNKQNTADISDTKADGSASLAGTSASAKASMGRTGVKFRFYTRSEYAKLSTAQKEKL